MRAFRAGLVASAIIAVGVTMAAPAWASDTFWLANNTGTDVYLSPNDACADSLSVDWTNNGSGVWGTFGPNDGEQSVTLTGGCSFSGSVDYYPQEGEAATIGFYPDDPFLGIPSLSCSLSSVYPQGLATPVMCSVAPDSLTASVELIPGASSTSSLISPRAAAAHVRFTSSLALVDSRDVASVIVTSWSDDKKSVRERVILRGAKTNKILGMGAATCTANKACIVKVKLPASVAKAGTRSSGLAVNAEVKHADGTAGSGDKVRRLTIWRYAR